MKWIEIDAKTCKLMLKYKHQYRITYTNMLVLYVFLIN